MRVTALAPGKVNLCLYLGGHLDDGRHEVMTLVESVSLADRLTLLSGTDGDQVHCPEVIGANLADDALKQLRARGWPAPSVQVEIQKRIPLAGGMGGGSADAAAVLRMALMVGAVAPGAVAEIAASLGADVPSQLAPGLMLGRHAGEVVAAHEPLAAHALLIVPLSRRLSTADVYREADRLGLGRSRAELEALIGELLEVLSPEARLPEHLLVNDLEPATLSLCPAVEEALEDVRAAGADRALVCGSGPTVAGLFWGPGASESAAAAAQRLVTRYPLAVPASPVGAEFGMPEMG